MWETAFEESMLSTHKNIIIHCTNEDLAEILMEVLEKNGVKWRGDELPTEDARWDEHEEDTCYWVESKYLSYGDKQYADENPNGEYTEHIRCTFYGIEGPDFDVASKSEILSLFSIWGGEHFVRVLRKPLEKDKPAFHQRGLHYPASKICTHGRQ